MKEKTLMKLEKEKLVNEQNGLLDKIAQLEEEDRLNEQKEMGIGLSNVKEHKKKKKQELWPEKLTNP